jgi:integrase
MADPIKTRTNPDGSVVWWFRISAGTDSTGKRVQLYRSFGTKREARAEHAKIVRDLADNRFVARDGITVNAYLDKWLPAHGRDLEVGSRTVIGHDLRPVRERVGERKLQSLTRADVDQLVDWMLTEGRKRGGQPGTGLSPRSVQRTLSVFQRACEDAIDERLMSVNPCRRVKRPKQVKPVHELWSDDEAALFGKAAAADRLAPVITLQCLGLRPEEVCGLRWRDVDLAAGTLTIRHARTLVDGKPIEKPPKTAAGRRVLPLDCALIAQLGAFRKLQSAEKRTAAEAYSDGGYVLCNELGEPSDPAKLRRVWYRLMGEAGVRKVKPYTASRHAAGSYLDRAGVSPAIIAAWLGHTDASFTMRTYVHARPEDLAAARDALAARNGNDEPLPGNGE